MNVQNFIPEKKQKARAPLVDISLQTLPQQLARAKLPHGT